MILRFLRRVLTVIGFITVVVVGFIAALIVHINENAPKVAKPETIVLMLDFERPVVERAEPSAFALALKDHEETALIDMLRAIEKAKNDSHVKGIVARFGSTQPSFAVAQEIRTALKDFRATNKFTYAYGASYGDFGLGNRAYYLASAFENIWLQPVGSVSLTGLAMQAPFGKTALDKIGVKADFFQREEYKSFMDSATRDSFAPQVKENMQALVDDLGRQVAEGIAESRSMDVVHVRDLMARGPFTDTEALQEKLVTRLGYADELDDELDKKSGTQCSCRAVGVAEYLSYVDAPLKAAKTNKTTIAFIHGTGMILDHEEGPSMMGDGVMGADKIAEAFDDAASASSVKAILFRIDSPGGSPSASETIRRAMIQAQKKGKPVYVSMGDVAASGGYWVAMNADRIFAQPGTLTGSIGVVGGKFVIHDLLQKLGVTMDSVKTSDNAGLWSMTDSFTAAQRDRINALMDNTYKAFTQNVATARKLPIEKIPDFAKGRVFTGTQAQQLGLVDELGGLSATVKALRTKLGLTPDDIVALEAFPAPPSPVERAMKLFRTFGAEGAMITSALRRYTTLRQMPKGAVLSPLAVEQLN